MLDTDRILDLYASGLTGTVIADRVGARDRYAVMSVVFSARHHGDPRAASRQPQARPAEPRPPRREPATTWTPELVGRLRELVDSGLSYGQIAGRLGVTRNAALAKAHRLGLAGRPVGASRAQAGAVRAAAKPQHGGHMSAGDVMRRIEARKAAAPTPPITCEPVREGGIDLLELREHSCRWPFGDGPFRFCGQTCSHEKTSYCEHHLRVSRDG